MQLAHTVCAVTGANGFVGAKLCARLLREGAEVRAVCRSTPSSDSALQALYEQQTNGNLHIIIADVTNRDHLETALQGAQAVFHLAALISYSPSDREKMKRVNVEGTENVIACLPKGARLVHCSSMGTIGASEEVPIEPLTEEWNYNLSKYNIGYCETKRSAEAAVLEHVKEHNVDAVIVNPCNVYGAGDALKGSRNTQVKVALGRFPVYTRGGVNVVHVDHVVDGMVRAFLHGRSGERYILGGENITVRELFSLIAAEAGVPAPFIYLPQCIQLALGHLGLAPLEKIIPANMYTWFSSEKACKELGYKGGSAADAIHDSVQFMKDNLPQFSNKTSKSSGFSTFAAGSVVTAAVLLYGFAAFRS